jgi:hypothetical protein
LHAGGLFDQLNRWFAGLWEGRQLGVTVACITLFIAAGLFLAARRSKENP